MWRNLTVNVVRVSDLSSVVSRFRRDLGRIIEATSCQLSPAVLVRARGPDAARAILTPDRYADVEVHNWQFGGRRRDPWMSAFSDPHH